MTRNEKETKFKERIEATKADLENLKKAYLLHKAAGQNTEAANDKIFIDWTLENLDELNQNYLNFLLEA